MLEGSRLQRYVNKIVEEGCGFYGIFMTLRMGHVIEMNIQATSVIVVWKERGSAFMQKGIENVEYQGLVENHKFENLLGSWVISFRYGVL